MLQKTTPSPCLAMPTPTLAARSTRYLLGAAVLAAAAYIAWQWWPTPQSLANVAGGNGRLEATPIDIATRAGGRIADVLVKEGDEVSAGQVLVRMDSATLLAELSRAQASVRQAEQARTTAQALVAQRQQAIQTATAVIRQREADLALARRQWERTRDLVDQGFLPPQKRDEAQAQLQGARAALAVAQSLVAEARTGLRAAEAQITEAEAAIEGFEVALGVEADVPQHVGIEPALPAAVVEIGGGEIRRTEHAIEQRQHRIAGDGAGIRVTGSPHQEGEARREREQLINAAAIRHEAERQEAELHLQACRRDQRQSRRQPARGGAPLMPAGGDRYLVRRGARLELGEK